MGDRGQVFIKDTKIYLYTHWTGTELRESVRAALARGKDRWDDPEYLARIIFCEMLAQSAKPLTEIDGFGIGESLHGDLNHPLVTIDCQSQTVSIEGETEEISFNRFVFTPTPEN